MKFKVKVKYLPLIAVISLLIIGSAYAATYGAYATLVFGVGALNQITVYQLQSGQAYNNTGNMATGAGYGLALQNIFFNSTTGNALWANATVLDGSASQDMTHPMIYVDNTGTTTATDLNISVANANAGDSCLDIRYQTNQSEGGGWTNTDDIATPTIGGDLNTSWVTIDASFLITDAPHGIWLYGNFSGCAQGQDTTTFYINATM